MRLPKQVSIEGSTLRKLDEKGIPLSDLVNRIATQLVELESASAEEITLSIMLTEREKMVNNIEIYKQQISLVEQQIASMDCKINKQKQNIQEIHRSERIASLIRKLNEDLESIAFDLEEAKGLSVLEDLKKEGVPISDSWLLRHIQRIENVGR
jgi:hypothetical protein